MHRRARRVRRTPRFPRGARISAAEGKFHRAPLDVRGEDDARALRRVPRRAARRRRAAAAAAAASAASRACRD